MRRIVSLLAGTALLAALPAVANAAPAQDFCYDADANFTPAAGGTKGRVNILAHCEAMAESWRLDVYVNGEWWESTTGGKISAVRDHWIGVDVPSMPKPNDRRGNFVWAKVTYKTGSWVNTYREELGWFPCKTCTS